MDLLRAILLGILQGATEFLPISSSGHLVLVPWWLGWDEPPVVFDVVLHLGTLMAVLVYFWRDWLTLLQAGIRALRTRTTQDPEARLLLLLIVGTIPAALAGALLEGFFESTFSDPPLVAVFLLVTAVVLIFSERHHSADRPLSDMNTRDALTIGLAQAIAIFPGISRSGSTIAAGLWEDLSRPEAARFSFLLAAPVILGAGVKKGLDIVTGSLTIGHDMVTPMVAGFVAAAVVGFLAIWFFMRLVQRQRLYGFAVYCAAFGTLSLLVALIR
ncbi:MAG TPA: undecaprenyl-diphosphatase UppP [Aggregatilineaceae bacterium]|nr:undecaprenyl-diphosphatase UppP [Aggregatilineaceae bacterium]